MRERRNTWIATQLQRAKLTPELFDEYTRGHKRETPRAEDFRETFEELTRGE